MAIQWKEPGTKDRLLAAIIAASPDLNMREVARLFGNGATYDAVEGQLRKAKQFAKTLKDEAVGRSEPAAAFPRVKKPKTGNGKETLLKTPVKGARVSKSRKAETLKIKAEFLYEDTLLASTTENGDDEEVDVDEV